MSLSAWIKKYYSVKADSPDLATDKQRLQHSLRKWIGLRRGILKRHRLTVVSATVHDSKGNTFVISSGTCALCEEHLSNTGCGKCPLVKVRGHDCGSGDRSPYSVFYSKSDPEPMIALIKAAMEKEKKT